MIFVSLVLSSLLQAAPESCTLKEGVGGEIGTIGVTLQNDTRPQPANVQFLYAEKGALDGIYVFPGSTCQTAKGIRIGDSEDRVLKIYGKGKKSHPRFKGEPWGDFAIKYDGVQFVITKHKVAMFCIGPLAAHP